MRPGDRLGPLDHEAWRTRRLKGFGNKHAADWGGGGTGAGGGGGEAPKPKIHLPQIRILIFFFLLFGRFTRLYKFLTTPNSFCFAFWTLY